MLWSNLLRKKRSDRADQTGSADVQTNHDEDPVANTDDDSEDEGKTKPSGLLELCKSCFLISYRTMRLLHLKRQQPTAN